MNTLSDTQAKSAAVTVLEQVKRASDLGPLYYSNEVAFTSLFNTRRVKSALEQNSLDAEDLAEAIIDSTAKWTHVKLKDAATAIVYISENRHVRQWLFFSKADLAWAIADSLTQAMIAEGWTPRDLVTTTA